jgi:hypothetical protein
MLFIIGLVWALITFFVIFYSDDYWLHGTGTLYIAFRRALLLTLISQFTGWALASCIRKK